MPIHVLKEVIGVNAGELRMRGTDGSPQPFVCRGDMIAIVYDDQSSKESGATETLLVATQLLHTVGAKKV